MKKIVTLIVLASLVLTSCNKERKDIKEVKFSINSIELTDNIIEVERGAILNLEADIRTNIFPGPSYYWNNYGDPREELNNDYHHSQHVVSGDEYSCQEIFNIPLDEAVYQANDHYVLSVRFGSDGSSEGKDLHVIIR